jgi:hypothetical protein
VETGSREENASKQKPGAFLRFKETRKCSKVFRLTESSIIVMRGIDPRIRLFKTDGLPGQARQ